MNEYLNSCRVCRKRNENEDFASIYDDSSDIALNVFIITGIKVLEFLNHDIPALICKNCTENLETAITFRKQCLESDEYFRKFINNVEESIWNQDCKDILHPHEVLKIKQEFDSDIDDVQPEVDLFAKIEEDSQNTEAEETEATNEDVKAPKEPKEKRRRIHRKLIDIENGIKSTRNALGMVECSICAKMFTRLHSLRLHMRGVHLQNVHEGNMFKCKFCGKAFKLEYYMKRHIKRTHSETEEGIKEKNEEYKCSYCDKYLSSRHILRDHIRVKHEASFDAEKFFCDFCGKDFPLKHYLMKHVRKVHLKIKSKAPKKLENEPKLPCSICGQLMKNKKTLWSHEKTHQAFNPSQYYYCDRCGNKFKSKGEMGVHIKRRHLYDIRYPCEMCPGKSWKTKFQLRQHIKVFHENIKEFKCEWCNKEFGDKNKLVSHSRIHTGEQPFQCNICGKKFTHQTDMRRHVWAHTGKYSFKCENLGCDRGFMKRNDLYTHQAKCQFRK